jgi:hypothetical protein
MERACWVDDQALSRVDVVFSRQWRVKPALSQQVSTFFLFPGQNALLFPAGLVLFFGSFDGKCM